MSSRDNEPRAAPRAEGERPDDSFDFSVDQDSLETPLILSGDAASTNFSDADPSHGTVSEAPRAIEATIDLDSDADGGDAAPSEAQTATINRAPVFRPTRRPPMAVLRVYDDGFGTHEEVRIRKTPFDIGRLEGDHVVPHELQMSRRHVRIERSPLKADPSSGPTPPYKWTLTDLKSMNGTFLRKPQLAIRDRSEVLIGGELVRFLLTGAGGSLVMVKVGPKHLEEKLTVKPGTAWIGNDQDKCLPFLIDNPFLDPQRLRLETDRRGRWSICDLSSTNGLWARIESTPLQHGAEWQCGEQRFAFHLT